MADDRYVSTAAKLATWKKMEGCLTELFRPSKPKDQPAENANEAPLQSP